MTTLRTAAQQALEALEAMESAEVDPHSSDAVYKAITALKEALVEDAMQKFTDVNQELQAALGCDHCNHPLYAAIKCRVCGRETEPVEPVAWMYSDDHERMLKTETFCTVYSVKVGSPDKGVTDVPLYAAPPQRKPLTREQAIALWADKSDGPSNGEIVSFARAIERAHGIKE